jgi:hypothetical protein
MDLESFAAVEHHRLAIREVVVVDGMGSSRSEALEAHDAGLDHPKVVPWR